MENFFLRAARAVPEFERLREALDRAGAPCDAVGLSHIHKAHMLYALCADRDAHAVVLTADEMEAARLQDDINRMAGSDLCVLYPQKDFVFRPVEGASSEYEHARIKALERLSLPDPVIIAASVGAALQGTIPPGVLMNRTFSLMPQQEWELHDLAMRLVRAGYVRRPQVDGLSQFSIRGGIVDIFPPHLDAPVRLELWGDTIDSVFTFDIDSQRRGGAVEAVDIVPCIETSPDDIRQLDDDIHAFAQTLTRSKEAKQQLLREADILRDTGELSNLDKYYPLCYDRLYTLLDHAKNSICFISEYLNVKESARAFSWQHGEDIKQLLTEGILCKGLDRYCADFGELQHDVLERPTLLLDAFVRGGHDIPLRDIINVNALSRNQWNGDVASLEEEIGDITARGFRCVILAGTKRAADALTRDLTRDGLSPGAPLDAPLAVLPQGLSAGFEYPGAKLAVVAHTRRVGDKKRRAVIDKEINKRITSLQDIRPGDYVVHAAHGIGLFGGIKKLEIEGVTKDYIQINYHGADTLFVPVTQLDLVTKYIGPRDDGAVKLNRLNSGDWQKQKRRVKESVRDMARELIKLYGKRLHTPGHAFAPDDDLTADFEGRFEYDETDDQLRCSREIKADMEKPYPMDRLLCGDVGFGKTEVALRAAFKCVKEGKQVALLVPTTILAWQHFQTISRRFEAFPVTVELLSRFRTPAQQKETLKKLARGSVDIVIGTHRLLQKDVKFKDLGLVIVDEEQRFGVKHKETLKELKTNVDILTLSATPIPRTLNMAMSSIRDMSIIEEPPADRYPVQTYVLEFDSSVILDAIRRELRRGGQAYYLHNRIESIERTAARLAAAIPEARILTAHGRMSETELSRVWEQVIEGECDILVCTTIIEAGVDVANVNTLVVEDADRMGLSQLYQIRGRVGRSHRRAFAYITFRRGKVLSEIATKRLEAIREFTRFGSGLSIAMRDMEIRGAGNILGGQQHGHMEAVGYDMYLKLLSDAVAEEQGAPVKDTDDECLVDIKLQAHIPESYIADTAQRIDIYRMIALIGSDADARAATAELRDRFGPPPASALGLIDVALLRNVAQQMGIYEIKEIDGTLYFYPREIEMERVSRLGAVYKGRVMVSAHHKSYIAVRLAQGEHSLDVMKQSLLALRGGGEDTEV